MNYSATERSLFLGDLSVYCTEQDIYEIFQSFGPIESIQLKRKATGNSRPSYGFVQFRFRESAEEALRVMNGRVIHGRAIRLGWAEPPKVEVKIGVKPDLTRPAEPVAALPSDLSFLTDSLAGLGLGGSSAASKPGNTTSALLGVISREKPKGLDYIIPPLDGNPIVSSKGVIDTAQVHFSYVTNKIDPLKEDVFRNVFQHFGTVMDVAIKKSQYHHDKGVQTGYGFIHYPLSEQGIISALEAVKSLHELVLDSVKYSCRVSHALEEFLKENQPGSRKKQQQQAPPAQSSSMMGGFSNFFPSSFNPFSRSSSSYSNNPPQPPMMSTYTMPNNLGINYGTTEYDYERFTTYDSYSRPTPDTYQNRPPLPAAPDAYSRQIPPSAAAPVAAPNPAVTNYTGYPTTNAMPPTVRTSNPYAPPKPTPYF